MDKDEEVWGGKLAFGFSEKRLEDYFFMFEDSHIHVLVGLEGFYPTSGRKGLWICWISTRMGTSVIVGGGKWTLRNGIFELKIFNDHYCNCASICFRCLDSSHIS